MNITSKCFLHRLLWYVDFPVNLGIEPKRNGNSSSPSVCHINMEALYSVPFTVLECPNLKLKKPSWVKKPSSMVVFAFVLISYFLVTGGKNECSIVCLLHPSLSVFIGEKGRYITQALIMHLFCTIIVCLSIHVASMCKLISQTGCFMHLYILSSVMDSSFGTETIRLSVLKRCGLTRDEITGSRFNIPQYL